MTYSLFNGTNTIPLQTTDHATYGSVRIQVYKSSKDAIIDETPIPTLNSNKTLQIDAMGVRRSIHIEGIATDPTQTKVDSFITGIEGFINSNQMFLSGAGGGTLGALKLTVEMPTSTTYSVLLTNFTWEYVAGTVPKIEWTMTLVEGNE